MEKIDLTSTLASAASMKPAERGISSMAAQLVGSEILKIAAEVRAQIAAGESILNLTVGDFSSQEFPVPEQLSAGITKALAAGHTNYPPSSGVMELRESVKGLFERRLGLSYPIESTLIAGGARPMIAGTYLALLDPGDEVIYGAPSWNNNHYCTLTGAKAIEVPTTAATSFFPTVEQIEAHLSTARLLCLNTPQNPTGTVMPPDQLEHIARRVVEENERRKSAGRPQLYLMFDQVYWLLTFDGVEHATPVNLVPEVAPYTIFVDGVSKGFAGTGLRVGWALGPQDVIQRMSAILTHLGAWAPRPEQIATAALLDDDRAIDQHLGIMRSEVLARLKLLDEAVGALRDKGWDVESIAPQGAIYLSMRLDLRGKKTPDGVTIETDEQTRKYLLEAAGVALVPFTCFGVRENTGWFRASVGAVSKADCESIKDRLAMALDRLS